MSLETDVCRAYLDVMDVVRTRVETALLGAARQGDIALTEENLGSVVRVVNQALSEVTDNGVTGITTPFKIHAKASKKKRKK